MILLIECDIDADIIISEVVEQKFHAYTVKFYPKESKKTS